MVLILALSYLVLSVYSQTNNVCVWDRKAPKAVNYHNNLLNGQFIYDGTFNSKSSWKKEQHQNCGPTLYLFWSTINTESSWKIGEVKGAMWWYAECSSTAIASCTAGSWKVFETTGTNQVDGYMRIISGVCPSWSCGSISTTDPSTYCSSFTTQLGRNAYKATNNYVLYFNDLYVSWLCINSEQYDYRDCLATFQMKTSMAWQDVSSGATSTFSTDFTYPSQSSVAMTCVGAGNPTTTPQPTTPQPTAGTTPQPTPPPVTPAPVYNPATNPVMASNNVCIWDRKNAQFFNNMLNGQYSYDGVSNSHSSWKKTQHASCGATEMFIYRATIGSRWVIGSVKGGSSSYAQCTMTDIAACTAGMWQVYERTTGGYATDATMRAISGSCPSWNCGTVTTNAPDGVCTAFTQQIATNVFKASNNYVLYYSTMYFSWLCINSAEYEYSSCAASFQLRTELGWTDLALGGSTTMPIDFSSPSQATLTVSCSTAGAPVPTPYPTQPNTVPTTKQPTGIPTKKPTASSPVTNPAYGSANTICVWGRTHATFLNNMLNGLYTNDGLYNSHSSWKKTQHGNCGPTLYIYWGPYGGTWCIGSTKGSTSWYAQCSHTSIDACIAGEWSVADTAGGFLVDSTMFAAHGNCPTWPCASITTDAPDDYCKTFETQLGANVYQGSNQFVLTFNTVYFSWYCINGGLYDYTDCRSGYALKTTTAWNEVTTGGTTSFDIMWSYPAQATLTVTCNGVGTVPTLPPVPTPQPTAGPPPTTPQPTAPTPQPTVTIPTPQPTVYNPVINPATLPTTTTTTKTPTSPAAIPTTKTPTNPALNPAANPAYLPTAPSNSVCIWDRKASRLVNYHNNMVNGQYLYDGMHNNYLSWKKTQHANCGSTLYIWRSSTNSAWVIGNSKGGSSWYAECSYTDIASCVAGQWKVSETSGQWESDSTMRAISGSCPRMSCAAITTDAPDDYCNTFTEHVAPNTYKASHNAFVLHFNTVYFSWFCINGGFYDYSDCRASYQLKTSPQWQDVAAGAFASFGIDFSYPSQANLMIMCNAVGAPLATPFPTNPTVYTPAPTPKPTEKPSPQPTHPALHPVNAPAYAPAQNPSALLTPAISPANSPVTIPTVYNPATNPVAANPAYQPVWPPAWNPVYNPANNPVASNPASNPLYTNPATNPAYNPVASTPTYGVSNPAPSPVSSNNNGDDDDDDDDDDGDTKSGLGGAVGGVGDWVIYLVIGVIVCCICVIIILCVAKKIKDKRYQKANDDPYADTVQMNPKGNNW